MWIDILLGVLIFGIMIYFIIFIIYPMNISDDLVPKVLPLNINKEIYNSTDTQLLLSSSGMSVFGFFNIKEGDKTVNYSTPFIPILQVENNWYLEITPSTNYNSTARLRVNTEIIDLPPIPKQKWVFIAILREGRRYDIIYDQQIVTSYRLEKFPEVITSPLTVGNSNVSGKFIHIKVNTKRLTPNEIEKERLVHVDTNNMVIDVDTIQSLFPSISVFGQCLPGLPCEPITKPNNNLLEWNTPYA
jgi:hypothetical protein